MFIEELLVNFLLNFINAKRFHAEQIFNSHEIGLFGKKLLSRTWLTIEEQKALSCKVAKDRFTLLFWVNAFGDQK